MGEVEVTRCRDCGYFSEPDSHGTGECRLVGEARDGVEYCSRAVARVRRTPYPEDVDDLVARCTELCRRYDLFQLGEPPQHDGWPDGTEDLSGEYQYGVAMIPARWVLHALGRDETEED